MILLPAVTIVITSADIIAKLRNSRNFPSFTTNYGTKKYLKKT